MTASRSRPRLDRLPGPGSALRRTGRASGTLPPAWAGVAELCGARAREAWGRHPPCGAPDAHLGSPWSCSRRAGLRALGLVLGYPVCALEGERLRHVGRSPPCTCLWDGAERGILQLCSPGAALGSGARAWAGDKGRRGRTRRTREGRERPPPRRSPDAPGLLRHGRAQPSGGQTVGPRAQPLDKTQGRFSSAKDGRFPRNWGNN